MQQDAEVLYQEFMADPTVLFDRIRYAVSEGASGLYLCAAGRYAALRAAITRIDGLSIGDPDKQGNVWIAWRELRRRRQS